MLTALCLNKPSYIIAIIIISQSSQCFSQQQQLAFDIFNQFKANEPNDANSQNVLNNRNWLKPGQELVFATTLSSLPSVQQRADLKPANELAFTTTTSKPFQNSVVFVNNQPTMVTLPPFIPSVTLPTPEFLKCFRECPATSEFNPICASNREVYNNEQKFNCAQRCGADIQIVRRGSCEGLFTMSRG